MSATITKNHQQFHLTNGRISYIIEIGQGAFPAHRYFGQALTSYQGANQLPPLKKTFASYFSEEEELYSLEFLPQEFPVAHQGDYKVPALQVRLANGDRVSRFTYKRFKMMEGCPPLEGLPQARNSKENPAKTLILELSDEVNALKLELFYTIFDKGSYIVRHSQLTNQGSKPIQLEHLASASIDLPFEEQDIIHFYGAHQGEFQKSTSKLTHGLFQIGSSRGASGPQYPPFIALAKNCDEIQGQVIATSLIYSGNHLESIERDQYDQVRLSIGLNKDEFSWQLEPTKKFTSPQAVLVFSAQGFNGMSQEFHHFSQEHLLPPHTKNQLAPILLNSWEMAYFDINEEKITQVINQAAELGFEAVVIDDGWFRGRINSHHGLGDWQVDNQKFPKGLKPIQELCHQRGMTLGIWFEPEMISPDSKLAQVHPNWIIKSPGNPVLLGRHQYILDLTLPEVQNFIIETLSQFITENGIGYIKWDMNRHFVENYSPSQPQYASKDFHHRYMLGLYKVLSHLTQKFPEVRFENCSSGGGRLDFGMLYFFPQTWASDNTDGLDRQEIQYGASYLFHPYQLTGHVSTTPNHQTNRTTPLQTRQLLASSTNMGYELDILNLNKEQVRAIQQHLETYKKERQLIQKGKFFRLSSPFSSYLTAWAFIDDKQETIHLYAFRNRFLPNQLYHLVKIPYLDVTTNYRLNDSDTIISGSELAYSGIQLNFDTGDYQAKRLELKKI